MNMRLLGARTINEIVPEMVDASALRSHAGLTPTDNLYNSTCKSFVETSPSAMSLPSFFSVQTNPCHWHPSKPNCNLLIISRLVLAFFGFLHAKCLLRSLFLLEQHVFLIYVLYLLSYLMTPNTHFSIFSWKSCKISESMMR